MPIDIGTCAICLEDEMKDPAALPCGHVFCLDCLKQSRRIGTPRLCPSCRRPYTEPIKLFISSSSPSSRPPLSGNPFKKSFAESTIPTPFFAEVQIRNLREDLCTLQSKFESTQRQLESALIEKRTLSGRYSKISDERNIAIRQRDELMVVKQDIERKMVRYADAGVRLEVQVSELKREVARLKDEVTRRDDTLIEMTTELMRREEELATTREELQTNSATSSSSLKTPLPTPPVSLDVSTPAALPRNPLVLRSASPTLPASMSLEEILAGGLRKYMPHRASRLNSNCG